jgi:hypothetical protein
VRKSRQLLKSVDVNGRKAYEATAGGRDKVKGSTPFFFVFFPLLEGGGTLE